MILFEYNDQSFDCRRKRTSCFHHCTLPIWRVLFDCNLLDRNKCSGIPCNTQMIVETVQMSMELWLLKANWNVPLLIGKDLHRCNSQRVLGHIEWSSHYMILLQLNDSFNNNWRWFLSFHTVHKWIVVEDCFSVAVFEEGGWFLEWTNPLLRIEI